MDIIDTQVEVNQVAVPDGREGVPDGREGVPDGREGVRPYSNVHLIISPDGIVAAKYEKVSPSDSQTVY